MFDEIGGISDFYTLIKAEYSGACHDIMMAASLTGYTRVTSKTNCSAQLLHASSSSMEHRETEVALMLC